MTFTQEDDFFEVRLIDVHGNKGLGSKISAAIHEYCDENNIDTVIASNVVSSARGFWEEMGYMESSDEDEFIRVR